MARRGFGCGFELECWFVEMVGVGNLLGLSGRIEVSYLNLTCLSMRKRNLNRISQIIPYPASTAISLIIQAIARCKKSNISIQHHRRIEVQNSLIDRLAASKCSQYFIITINLHVVDLRQDGRVDIRSKARAGISVEMENAISIEIQSRVCDGSLSHGDYAGAGG